MPAFPSSQLRSTLPPHLLGEFFNLRPISHALQASFSINGRNGIFSKELGHIAPPKPFLTGRQYQNWLQAHKRAARPISILSFNDVYDLIKGDEQESDFRKFAWLVNELKYLNSLLFFSGDTLGSGAMSSHFQGRQMIAALNLLGVRAAVVGNHEFDFSDYNITLKRFQESRFPWLSSNLTQANGVPLPGTKLFHIVEHEGAKIGIIGLVSDWRNEGTKFASFPFVSKYEDYIQVGQRLSKKLKKEHGVDYVIALTHMYTHQDKSLSRANSDIDLIIGGHQHKPIETNPNERLIKSGEDWMYLGLTHLQKDPLGRSLIAFMENIPVAPIEHILYSADRLLQKTFKEYNQKVRGDKISVLVTPLIGSRHEMRLEETLAGNLVADTFRQHGNKLLQKAGIQSEVDIAICNGGSLRPYQTSLKTTGDIYEGDIRALMANSNEKFLRIMKLSGHQVLEMLEHGVSDLAKPNGRFLQISGAEYTYDRNKPVGQRIVDVQINGIPIDPETDYLVAMEDFLSEGGDGFSMLPKGEFITEDPDKTSTQQILIDYLKTLPFVLVEKDGRIQPS